jgi:hypothetical protein
MIHSFQFQMYLAQDRDWGSGYRHRGDYVDAVQKARQHTGDRTGGGDRYKCKHDSGHEVLEGRDSRIVAQ